VTRAPRSAGTYRPTLPRRGFVDLRQFRTAPPAPARTTVTWDDAELPQHRASHSGLLRKLVTDPVTRSSAPLLNAIIMPTNRRLDEQRSGVRLAARLAEQLGRRGPRPTVVLLCSGAARSEHLPRDLFAGTRVLTIDLPSDHQPVWPHLRTSDHIVSRHRRRNDVGLKRNHGLVLALAMGWQYVLLLDDDVSRLRSAPETDAAHFGLGNIADALGALGEARSRAAGWVLDDFADNSVVCHARRLVALPQDKFIGGGALLVRCGDQLPFFPATYNEDWLFMVPFMLDDADRERALILGGLLGQDRYSVWVEKRARSEELGDLLGEGLFNLLSVPARDFEALSTSYEYWQAVTDRRRAMIGQILGHLGRGQVVRGRQDEIGPAARALAAALDVHAGHDWSAQLATYTRRWQQDLRTWRDWLPTVRGEWTARRLGFREAQSAL
jgi:hypothetical protein